MSEWCEREDHIDAKSIQSCPRCNSKGWNIQESLMVTEYCDQIHLIDVFQCFKCDAHISLDLLLRLLTVEQELGKYVEWAKELAEKTDRRATEK